MTSAIDPSVPVYGSPTTESVRNNFAVAASEISALQAAFLGQPPVTTITSGGLTVIAAGVIRVYVRTTAAVNLTLPQNDCIIADRTGSRSNPITVSGPGGTLINGLSAFAMVDPWQAKNFLWDSGGNGYTVV